MSFTAKLDKMEVLFHYEKKGRGIAAGVILWKRAEAEQISKYRFYPGYKAELGTTD